MRIPDFEPPAVELRQDETRKRLVLGYRLLTPLFGGGPLAGECDPLTTVRTATVVGQLRFWWRACRAAAYPDLKSLRAAEDRLWGSTTVRSPIVLELRRTQAGEPQKPFTLKPGQSWPDCHEDVAPAYAAFPLQPNSKDRTVRTVQSGVGFELVVSYPAAAEADVRAALWAWETFGGVGARTRRGFGALARMTEDGRAVQRPPCRELLDWIQAELQRHVLEVGKPIPGVPRLEHKLPLAATRQKAGPGEKSAREAWKCLIKCYRDFRQSRRTGTGKSGRSYWPEPDAIRRLTGQADPKHRVPVCKIDRFPRGAFGLPIIFHFKDRTDPDTCTLQGPKHDRRASPLILRPVLGSDGAIGMAAILKPWGGPPGGYVLKGGRLPGVEVQVDLNGIPAGELAAIKPLKPSDKLYNNVFDPFREMVKEA
ncbi:MAG: type III-B CRISPR module RAMP protein Cmr1 [Candidatus Xenobium sp.]|jgi:CRISPR-associated protein Cmr1